MPLNPPPVDGKKLVRLYDIAILMGFSPERAKRYSETGINLQTITKVYDNGTHQND